MATGVAAEELNPATLHYLDVIYRITRRAEAANTTEIAARIGVTPSGASVMLKRLADRKLIALTPYRGATLTPAGARVALRTIRRHRLLEAFLHDVMRFAWDEVDAHAHSLETSINEAFEDRMDALLGHPIRCPHGHLIPSKDGVLPVVNDVRLVDQKPGMEGIIRCVDTDNADWLRYIGGLGLLPGARVVVGDVAPYGGPITLQKGPDTVSLGRNLAEIVYVEPV